MRRAEIFEDDGNFIFAHCQISRGTISLPISSLSLSLFPPSSLSFSLSVFLLLGTRSKYRE